MVKMNLYEVLFSHQFSGTQIEYLGLYFQLILNDSEVCLRTIVILGWELPFQNLATTNLEPYLPLLDLRHPVV